MKIYGEVEGILFLSDEPTYKSMSLFFLNGEISPWDYDTILEFPDAALVPDFASATSGAGNVPTAGDLALQGGKTLLRAAISTGAARYVDTQTGQVSSSVAGTPPVIISRWSIVPTRDAKEPLVEFTPVQEGR